MAWSPPALKRRKWFVEQTRNYATNLFPPHPRRHHGRRSLVETTIGRYKHIIGPKLRARSTAGQKGEVAIAIYALNRMIQIAKPISVPAM